MLSTAKDLLHWDLETRGRSFGRFHSLRMTTFCRALDPYFATTYIPPSVTGAVAQLG